MASSTLNDEPTVYRLLSTYQHPPLETTHFINPGYGWLCKHCSVRDDVHIEKGTRRARFLTEGEAEEKEPKLSTLALAKWRDPAHRILVCPRCGIEEIVNKA